MEDDYQNMVIVGLEEQLTIITAEHDALRAALEEIASGKTHCLAYEKRDGKRCIDIARNAIKER